MSKPAQLEAGRHLFEELTARPIKQPPNRLIASNLARHDHLKRGPRRARQRPRSTEPSRSSFNQRAAHKRKLAHLISRVLLSFLQASSCLPRVYGSPGADFFATPAAGGRVATPARRQYVAASPAVAAVARLSTPLDDEFVAAGISDEPRHGARRGGEPPGSQLLAFPDGSESLATRSVSRRGGDADDFARRNLIEFLESLPILSVGQKHRAQFECELNEDMTRQNLNFKLVWLKLVRNNSLGGDHSRRDKSGLKNHSDDAARPSPADEVLEANPNDITLLSLNKRTITPDKRFKVQHQPPSKWTLTIDNVGLNDDKAYYLCQAGGAAHAIAPANGLNFIGGARLNVMVPPKIIENETSPNLVQVDEFNQLRLQCKVISEPQSQISWRREDGKSLDGIEQRFRHHIERRPHQVVSVDSGELLFDAVRREQAGAYLCIASNGVRPGVSQRISVAVGNCRRSSEREAKTESCDQLIADDDDNQNGSNEIDVAPSSTPPADTKKPAPSSSMAPPRQSVGWLPKRSNWTSSNGRGEQARRSQQQQQLTAHRVSAGPANQTDKSRGSRCK